MGRRGEEGVATEGAQIDCAKGHRHVSGQAIFLKCGLYVEIEKVDRAAIDLADPVPKDFASGCGEIASVI